MSSLVLHEQKVLEHYLSNLRRKVVGYLWSLSLVLGVKKYYTQVNLNFKLSYGGAVFVVCFL